MKKGIIFIVVLFFEVFAYSQSPYVLHLEGGGFKVGNYEVAQKGDDFVLISDKAIEISGILIYGNASDSCLVKTEDSIIFRSRFKDYTGSKVPKDGQGAVRFNLIPGNKYIISHGDKIWSVWVANGFIRHNSDISLLKDTMIKIGDSIFATSDTLCLSVDSTTIRSWDKEMKLSKNGIPLKKKFYVGFEDCNFTTYNKIDSVEDSIFRVGDTLLIAFDDGRKAITILCPETHVGKKTLEEWIKNNAHNALVCIIILVCVVILLIFTLIGILLFIHRKNFCRKQTDNVLLEDENNIVKLLNNIFDDNKKNKDKEKEEKEQEDTNKRRENETTKNEKKEMMISVEVAQQLKENIIVYFEKRASVEEDSKQAAVDEAVKKANEAKEEVIKKLREEKEKAEKNAKDAEVSKQAAVDEAVKKANEAKEEVIKKLREEKEKAEKNAMDAEDSKQAAVDEAVKKANEAKEEVIKKLREEKEKAEKNAKDAEDSKQTAVDEAVKKEKEIFKKELDAEKNNTSEYRQLAELIVAPRQSTLDYAKTAVDIIMDVQDTLVKAVEYERKGIFADDDLSYFFHKSMNKFTASTGNKTVQAWLAELPLFSQGGLYSTSKQSQLRSVFAEHKTVEEQLKSLKFRLHHDLMDCYGSAALILLQELSNIQKLSGVAIDTKVTDYFLDKQKVVREKLEKLSYKVVYTDLFTKFQGGDDYKSVGSVSVESFGHEAVMEVKKIALRYGNSKDKTEVIINR